MCLWYKCQRGHLISDTILGEATSGTYTVCGQLPDVYGLGIMFTEAAAAVHDSSESLTSAE